MIFLYKAGSLTFATSVKSESVKFESSFIYKSWPPDTDLAFPPICFSGQFSSFLVFCCCCIYSVLYFKALLVPNELKDKGVKCNHLSFSPLPTSSNLPLTNTTLKSS